MSATIDTWTGRFGLLAGVCLVATWLAFTGSPGAVAEPPASIRLGALANGELELSPLGRPLLADSSLRSGGAGARGTLRVRNRTPSTLSFAVRTSPTGDLARSASIEIADGDRPLVRTKLSSSQRWSSPALTLASGESRSLAVRVWIPRDAPDGWQAASGDATLEFASDAGRVP